MRGVNWLGDAVMATPALQRLREAKPTASITLLTPIKLSDLWRHHPDLDAVLTFDPGESLRQIAQRLRQANFTLALVLPNSLRSALEVFLARIPQRIGYRRTWRGLLLTHALAARSDERRMRKRPDREVKRLVATAPNQPRATFPPESHHIHQYLYLAGALGANPTPTPPRLSVHDDEIAAFTERFGLRSEGAQQEPWFGLNPGAAYGAAKCWPKDRFVAAAVALRKRTGCRWLIVGGPSEVPLAEEIADGIGRALGPRTGQKGPAVLNLAGQTSLRELCAALKRCSLLLTNDSGPMHLAAALGTAVVVPFGSTAPELTGPGLPGDPRHARLAGQAPCAPCFRRSCPVDHRCMTRITVDDVVEAVAQVFSPGTTNAS